MDHAILVDHRIAVRRERTPQRHVRIEHAVLIEVDDLQRVGGANLARRRRQLAREQPQQRRLPAAVRADQADPHAGGKNEVEIVEQRAAADIEADIFQLDQPPGLPVGRGEIDAGAGRAGTRIQVRQFADQLIRLVDARL